MKIDFITTPINLSLELARICNPYAAIVYAALLAYSKDGYIVIGNRKLAELTNVPERSIPKVIRQLVEFGIITRTQERGCTNQYQVKDVFETIQPERNDTAEVPAEQAEPARQSERQPEPKRKPKMSYSVMLYKIRSPLYSEGYESETEIVTDDREIESCILPVEFCFAEDMQDIVADALKYTAYYSELREGEYKDFVDATLTCIAEAICTGMKNKKDSCNPNYLIKRINEINRKDGLGQWLNEFAIKYSSLLERYAHEIKNNRHNYLKTCAVNYLTESKAGIMPGFMDYDEE